MTVLAYKPLVEELASGIATFVYPPGSFNVDEDGKTITNRHPIRVFQNNSSTMACPRNMFLMMASMQLDCDVSYEQAIKPFYAFIEKSFPGLSNPDNHMDKETGKPFTKCAIEIYPEKNEVSGSEEQPTLMKTEAELLASKESTP